MNLRPRVFDNCTLARVQAAVVALLYAFLCTFGMVTHTHAPEEQAAATIGVRSAAVASSRTSAPSASNKQSRKRALKAAPHCAFCDWEANSQGRTVLPVRLQAPSTLVCVYLRFASFATPVFPTRSSSRAPPLA